MTEERFERPTGQRNILTEKYFHTKHIIRNRTAKPGLLYRYILKCWLFHVQEAVANFSTFNLVDQ